MRLRLHERKRKRHNGSARSEAVIDASVEISSQRADDLHALPWPNLLQRGAIVGYRALRHSSPARELHLDHAAVSTERSTRSVGDQFGHDHAHPPATPGAELQRKLPEKKFD